MKHSISHQRKTATAEKKYELTIECDCQSYIFMNRFNTKKIEKILIKKKEYIFLLDIGKILQRQ